MVIQRRYKLHKFGEHDFSLHFKNQLNGFFFRIQVCGYIINLYSIIFLEVHIFNLFAIKMQSLKNGRKTTGVLYYRWLIQ